MASPLTVMANGLVTVFGGTGFLGRRIVRQLADRGLPVRVAARRPATPGLRGLAGLECRALDIRDAGRVGAALEGADAAVNAVSLYVERGHARFRDIHVDAAGALARSAASAGVDRLVHVSGIGADPDSASAYVAARGAGEAAVRDAMPGAVLVRPSVLYGPDGGLLSTLDGLTRLPLIPLFGAGDTRLQPVHADDVATAVVRTLVDRGTPGRTYELGGPDVLTYREIVRMVLRHRGRRRPMVPVPFRVWRALATLASVLPNPPLTRDQVILMEQDNTVAASAPSLESLGVQPQPLGTALRACLP